MVTEPAIVFCKSSSKTQRNEIRVVLIEQMSAVTLQTMRGNANHLWVSMSEYTQVRVSMGEQECV